jgi:hypothetical protein
MKNLKHKLFRWLGITKPIPLSKQEVKWVKLLKGHYGHKSGTWIDTIKPTFNEIYGWNADEYYEDFLDCMFKKLLELHLKISDDVSGHNAQLKEIFYSAFGKTIYTQEEKPIERAIHMLCSHIRNTVVIKNGIKRFEL